jgi:hypothetical protein
MEKSNGVRSGDLAGQVPMLTTRPGNNSSKESQIFSTESNHFQIYRNAPNLKMGPTIVPYKVDH